MSLLFSVKAAEWERAARLMRIFMITQIRRGMPSLFKLADISVFTTFKYHNVLFPIFLIG